MSRKRDVELRLRALEQEYARLTRFPEVDVFENGTIIAWVADAAFARDKRYNFAAIRAIGVWYVTGYEGRHGPRDWDSLIGFIGAGENVRIIDPDVGVELDELVIEEGDDGLPWRNRVKEARNAVSDDVIGWSDRTYVAGSDVELAADPPAGTVTREKDDEVSGGR